MPRDPGTTPPTSTAQLLEIMEAVLPVARATGRFAKARFDESLAGTRALNVSVKTVPGDVVTEVDVESQRRIAEFLRREFGGFALLGEEGLAEGADPSGGGGTWVIDPLDGTHNFVRGYPGFCVSIGLVMGGRSVLGVIYDAEQDAAYYAVEGAGAWREGVRLERKPAPLERAMLTTNFTDASRDEPSHLEFFSALATRSAGVRASGSACRDLCFLADGRVDLFWQFGLRAWDVAAGLVLVREAGCEAWVLGENASWWDGRPIDVLAGVPGVSDDALRLANQMVSRRADHP